MPCHDKAPASGVCHEPELRSWWGWRAVPAGHPRFSASEFGMKSSGVTFFPGWGLLPRKKGDDEPIPLLPAGQRLFAGEEAARGQAGLIRRSGRLCAAIKKSVGNFKVLAHGQTFGSGANARRQITDPCQFRPLEITVGDDARSPSLAPWSRPRHLHHRTGCEYSTGRVTPAPT